MVEEEEVDDKIPFPILLCLSRIKASSCLTQDPIEEEEGEIGEATGERRGDICVRGMRGKDD